MVEALIAALLVLVTVNIALLGWALTQAVKLTAAIARLDVQVERLESRMEKVEAAQE